MAKITLTDGDFGTGPAAADLTAFHLPDPTQPGATLVVPFTGVAEMTMVGSDNTNRIMSAVRTGLSGLLSLGPVGVSAGLLAARKAPQTVFSVRLHDGRAFTALAEAGAFAEIHAAHVEGQSADRLHPADDVIERYLAQRRTIARAAAAPVSPVAQPTLPGPPREPAVPSAGRPAVTFGRRTVRPA